MTWFKNPDKERRARGVVVSPSLFPSEGVERVALGRAQAEKLEGEELIKAIYQTMGGAIGTDEEKVVVEKKQKKAKKNDE